MRLNILIFCSWLNLDDYVGIFFREQAKIIDEFYEPILVTFNKQVVGLRGIFKRKSLYSVIEKKTPENLVYIECRYIQNRFFPQKINAIIKNNTIHFLSKYLKNKRIKISLIHAQSLFDAGIWANRYSEAYKVPYIITEHNQISINNLTKSNYYTIKKVLSQSKNNLVVSKELIRQFAINGLFFNFTVIGNLVSEKIFYISKKRESKTLHFITNGAYSMIKDQKTILDALLIVDNKNYPIYFSWIGFNAWGVDNYSKIQCLIDEYKFKNVMINLIPHLNRNDVARILNEADVFLLSSLSETFNISVLEAIACGKPVITTQCGGINEMITSENGFIIDIKDSKAMANIMEGFINNKYFFNSELISRKAISFFGEASFKKRLLSIYSNAIGEKYH